MLKRELFPNKIFATILIFLGFVTIKFLEDGTASILLWGLGLALFFAKRNWTEL